MSKTTKRTERLKELGLCATCGKKPSDGGYRCLICKQKHRDSSRRYRLFGTVDRQSSMARRAAIEACGSELAKRVLRNYFERGIA